MRENRRRFAARKNFSYHDRVPVLYCLEPRYFAPIAGVSYRDFCSDSETQYRLELDFAKYRIERIPEDFCQSPDIAVYPYFDNAVAASAFGCEAVFSDSETVQAIPFVKRPDDLDRLEMPGPDSGLWGTVRKWWEEMNRLASETKVTFDGTEGRVVVSPLSVAGYGPHMIAVDVAGEHFYLWMAEFPELCHRFLTRVTDTLIAVEKTFRSIDPRPRGAYGLAEDSIQVCSKAMYEEFCMPYDNRLYEEFGAGLPDGRGMHMCGDSTHLLDSLASGSRISSFNVFGCRVDPQTAAEKLGGTTRLWGNIDPVAMLNGSPDEVKALAQRALEAMAPTGGYMLGDGANVCPGTPIENLQAVMDAATEYGRPHSYRTSPDAC